MAEPARRPGRVARALDGYFHITARDSTVSTEIKGGLPPGGRSAARPAPLGEAAAPQKDSGRAGFRHPWSRAAAAARRRRRGQGGGHAAASRAHRKPCCPPPRPAAGVCTFLTMSYILLVNPQILAVAGAGARAAWWAASRPAAQTRRHLPPTAAAAAATPTRSPFTPPPCPAPGLPAKQVVTATAVASMVASLLVGLCCNMPFGLSPGMGLNAYLVYSQVLGADVPVDAALAGCLAAAGLVAVLALVRALRVILAVVPDSIKLATVVGMGLLLTFIGLQSAGIVVADPETMVTVGDLLALKPAIAIGGLALITSLSYRNVRGGIMIGILLAALAYFGAAGGWPTRFVDIPHLRVGAFDWHGLFVAPAAGAWNAVAAYSLVMVFDIGGAMFGLGNLAGIVKDGAIPGMTRAYLAACAGTALGAVMGARLAAAPRRCCLAAGDCIRRGGGACPKAAVADPSPPLPPARARRHDARDHRRRERGGHQGGRPHGAGRGHHLRLLRAVRLLRALPAVHPAGARRACVHV